MENIIKEISKIENVARSITLGIDAAEKDLPVRIRERCAEIDKKLENEARTRLSAYSDKCYDAVGKEVAVIHKEAQKLFSQIEEEYYSKCDEWATEIFESITRDG